MFIILMVYDFRWQFWIQWRSVASQSPVEVAKSSFENISLLKAIWLIG